MCKKHSLICFRLVRQYCTMMLPWLDSTTRCGCQNNPQNLSCSSQQSSTEMFNKFKIIYGKIRCKRHKCIVKSRLLWTRINRKSPGEHSKQSGMKKLQHDHRLSIIAFEIRAGRWVIFWTWRKIQLQELVLSIVRNMKQIIAWSTIWNYQ